MQQQLVAPPVEPARPLPPVRMRGRWQRLVASPLTLLAMALGLATLMWMVDFQPVSSDATKLTVAYEPDVSDGDLLNLEAEVWKTTRKNPISKEVDPSNQPTGNISTTIIPLSAQYIAPQQGGSLLQIQARAAFNNKTMAVLVQWQDNTKNVANNLANNQYSDSVALEFPLVLIPGHQPFRCMGQNGSEVNIWQWKAEREPSVAGPTRIYGAPGGKAVKNYLGPGLGYLKDSAGADPDSTARYDEATKTWSVIFRRDLRTGNEKEATQFKPGDATLVAFAVWDGGAGERLSKKAVSTWVDFIYQPGETTTQNLINLFAMGGVGVLMLAAIVLAWRFLPNTRRVTRE